MYVPLSRDIDSSAARAGRASPLHTCCCGGISWPRAVFSCLCSLVSPSRRIYVIVAVCLSFCLFKRHLSPKMKDVNYCHIFKTFKWASYIRYTKRVNLFWTHKIFCMHHIDFELSDGPFRVTLFTLCFSVIVIETFVFDGNRQSIHYLVEVCGLSTRLLDSSLRSPLHLACSKGHHATVVYLLKNQVSTAAQFKCFNLVRLIFLIIFTQLRNVVCKIWTSNVPLSRPNAGPRLEYSCITNLTCGVLFSFFTVIITVSVST